MTQELLSCGDATKIHDELRGRLYFSISCWLSESTVSREYTLKEDEQIRLSNVDETLIRVFQKRKRGKKTYDTFFVTQNDSDAEDNEYELGVDYTLATDDLIYILNILENALD